MLLTASVYGYLRWIGNRVRMEFAPGIFFTSLCSVMFLAGILNILPETAQVKLCSVREIPEDLSIQGYDYLICFGDSWELDEYLLRTFGSREIRVLTLPQP